MNKQWNLPVTNQTGWYKDRERIEYGILRFLNQQRIICSICSITWDKLLISKFHNSHHKPSYRRLSTNMMFLHPIKNPITLTHLLNPSIRSCKLSVDISGRWEHVGLWYRRSRRLWDRFPFWFMQLRYAFKRGSYWFVWQAPTRRMMDYNIYNSSNL